MFWICETEESIERLKKIGGEVFICMTPSHFSYHPKVDQGVVSVYVRPLSKDSGFILPIQHSEGLNLTKEKVREVLSTFTTKYVVDKKNLLYHFHLDNVVDLKLVYSMLDYEILELPDPPSTINWYYNRYYGRKDLNSIIPLSKLHERSERNYRSVKDVIRRSEEVVDTKPWKFYNNISTSVYYLMEQSGLNTDRDRFIELFKPNVPEYSMEGSKIFTYYNPYNVTSRPTNAFNSVNFAAIPKKGDHRTTIIPSKDIFVEFDFDGYHIRLLSELVGEPIKGKSAHTDLAKIYFNTELVTEEQYNEGKQITFQIVYGKIPDKYKHIPLFSKIGKFIDELWKLYDLEGFIEDPVSGRKLTKKLKDMHPQKLMNYLMQSLETSRNITILYKVLKYLQNKETKVSLYTYDSILFDFSKQDGKDTLSDLEEILSEGGKYPVKFRYSDNLVM